MTRLVTILAAAAAVLIPGTGRADVLTLKSGQVFEGKVTEQDGTVRLSLPHAAVTFSKDEVAGITYGPTPAEVYAERAAKLSAKDAEGHYQLGLWALGKGMVEYAKAEFAQAIAGDPNHAGAREKLGFALRNGRWVSREEQMIEKGYVQYKGRWMPQDEAEDRAAKAEALAREREARTLIRILAGNISQSRGQDLADNQDKLAGVSDPAALVPLIEQLDNSDPNVRTAVVLALMNYREDAAALAALDEAVFDDNESVRYQARIVLAKKQNEKAFQRAVYLAGSGDDTARFRAASALGAIGDPRAIPVLIENLSWSAPAPVRRVQAPIGPQVPPSYVAGIQAKVAERAVAYTPIFGGFYYGRPVTIYPAPEPDTWSTQPQIFNELVFNYEALAALKAMTGQDFRFEKESWRSWYLPNARRFEKSAAGDRSAR